MIDVNELRKGVTFELDGTLYKVLDYEHHKSGRGKATIRIKARDLRTGAVLDKSFISSDKVQEIRLDHHKVQYLYNDGEFYHFMDLETYEQPALPVSALGDDILYLMEGAEIKLIQLDGETIDYDLPTTVEMKVAATEMAVAGDTATGATKELTLETGLKMRAPLFINIGDTIRVDTRSGEYLSRA